MTTPRDYWRNCAFEVDDEMRALDAMEDSLGTVPPEALKIRELISTLEICHHKAERWIDNIIQAIGAGNTNKGLLTRPSESRHPVEQVWENAVAALTAWRDGSPVSHINLTIGDQPASQLLANLGDRTSLKQWQIQRVIEKIHSVITWAQPTVDEEENQSTEEYTWLLLGGGEYEPEYRNDCPEPYRSHEHSWQTTARTLIHDTADGQQATLSLALAIDMLWPCHRNFTDNLQLVLDAIGGNLHPQQPFAACGRNITQIANRKRLEQISNILTHFCNNAQSGASEQEKQAGIDRAILKALGSPTPTKTWLAASLDKTIRLQLHPPPKLQAAAALIGPDWIH